MTKNLLLIIILLFKLTLNAQEIFYISLENQDKISSFPKFYVEKIIDSRDDTSNLGLINRYVQKRKDKLNFKQDFEQELTLFLGVNMKAKKEKLPIILQINELKLEEFNAQPWVKLTIDMSFLEKKENNYIKHFTARESAFYQTRMLLRKDAYEKMFANIIKKCLDEFSNRLIHKKLYPKILKNLTEKEQENKDSFKIVKKLTKGTYYSYSKYMTKKESRRVKFF